MSNQSFVPDTFPCTIIHHDPESGAATGKVYNLLRQIAAGGFGVVYEGIDTSQRQRSKVAVKFMHANLATKPDLVQRFKREARIARSISNPHVIATHEFGIDQYGRWFSVMEYVETEASVGDLIDERAIQFSTTGERRNPLTGMIDTSLVPIPELCTLVIEMCEGMQAIHDQGVVHRDLKPENVMIVVESDGRRVIKITDLGIARSIEQSMDGQTIGAPLTKEGGVLGTPNFMAPEMLMNIPSPPGRFAGKSWGACVQSDIYALGVMIYLMVTSSLPYALTEAEAKDGQLNLLTERIWYEQHPVPPLTNFVTPSDPERAEFNVFATYLVERLLAKRPWDRPESMRDVQRWFTDFLARYLAKFDSREDVMPAAAHASKTSPRMSVTLARSHRWVIGAVFGVALLFATMLAIVFPTRSSVRKTDPTAKRVESVSATQILASSSPVLESSSAIVHPTAVPSLLKRPAGNGPANESDDRKKYARAKDSKDCARAISYSLLMLAKYPNFPEPHRVIAECKRKAKQVGEACEHYAAFLAFEGTTLPADALPFVAKHCATTN